MFKAGFIDTWGRGYKKIQDGFKAAGLPMPTVTSEFGGTTVTFQRGYDVLMGRRLINSDGSSNGDSDSSFVGSDVSSSVTSHVTSLLPVQLSERQKKICELITDNAYISGERMSVVLSVASRTIWRDHAALQKMGVLLREGNTSAGRWVLLIKK